jgi:hypothetical protein
MKLLMAYNFTVEEAHVETPNFYRACAEQVFPGLGVKTTFLPNLRTCLLFRLLTFVRCKESIALMIAVTWWIFRNGHKFDVIVGWVAHGIVAAFLRCIMRWPRTRVCLILYKLTDEKRCGFIPAVKRRIMITASRGADLLLALDTSQANSFARILRRKAGTTRPLTYGVDSNWYDARIQNLPHHTVPMTIFCPGSAHRDDVTLERAVSDLNVRVKRFQLDGSGVFTFRSSTTGRANLEKIFNAPYSHYLDECRSAAVVVIAVSNADKPVGLTSLLECMSLGCPVIITRGTSSHDYVRDGVTGLLYEEGSWKDLQEKINYLFEHPDVAKKIGEAARESAQKIHGLKTCGEHFFNYLHEIEMKNA